MTRKHFYAAIALVFFMLAKTPPGVSQVAIPADTHVGTWDSDNRIFTLTTDVNETIQVDEDNLTLDGGGHTVAGSGTGDGIYLNSRTGVTLKNLNVENFWSGVHLYRSTHIAVTNNAASNNTYGIYLDDSDDNVATGNSADSNSTVGINLGHSCGNIVRDNTANANNQWGISLHSYSDNNAVTDNTASSNDSVGIGINESRGNILTGNTTNFNEFSGISLRDSSDNVVIGNTASSNQFDGIHLLDSSTNSLIGNVADWNTWCGIRLYGSCGNTLTDNAVSSNNSWGVLLFSYSSGNTVSGNRISNNLYGISLYSFCDDNRVFNNNFLDNLTQASISGDSTGNVFNLPAPIGGNHWSDWTRPDHDRDGFVDSPYVFTGGQDDLPWAYGSAWVIQPIRDQIEELIAYVLALNIHAGISNSLDAKLDSALNALDDLNDNNDVAAINSMQAFINHVEAQSGDKIPVADADYLIASAQAIIAALSDL